MEQNKQNMFLILCFLCNLLWAEFNFFIYHMPHESHKDEILKLWYIIQLYFVSFVQFSYVCLSQCFDVEFIICIKYTNKLM